MSTKWPKIHSSLIIHAREMCERTCAHLFKSKYVRLEAAPEKRKKDQI